MVVVVREPERKYRNRLVAVAAKGCRRTGTAAALRHPPDGSVSTHAKPDGVR